MPIAAEKPLIVGHPSDTKIFVFKPPCAKHSTSRAPLLKMATRRFVARPARRSPLTPTGTPTARTRVWNRNRRSARDLRDRGRTFHHYHLINRSRALAIIASFSARSRVQTRKSNCAFIWSARKSFVHHLLFAPIFCRMSTAAGAAHLLKAKKQDFESKLKWSKTSFCLHEFFCRETIIVAQTLCTQMNINCNPNLRPAKRAPNCTQFLSSIRQRRRQAMQTAKLHAAGANIRKKNGVKNASSRRQAAG